MLRRVSSLVFCLLLLPSAGMLFSRVSEAKMVANEAMAPMLPPEPPEQNPHPPQTPEDIRRVAFAEDAARRMLGQSLSLNAGGSNETKPGDYFQNKDAACLLRSECYQRDGLFVRELIQIQNLYGSFSDFRHAHVIPWSVQNLPVPPVVPENPPNTPHSRIPELDSAKDVAPPQGGASLSEAAMGPQLKPGEFMVHIYAKSSKTGAWNHLDVILVEDAQGNVFLHHFYTIPMPPKYGTLPPGVVC